MAELLKNIYNEAFFDKFTKALEEVVSDFDAPSFLAYIYDEEWDKRELKQRMRHITHALKQQLPDDFDRNAATILKLIPALQKQGFGADSLEFIILPDFIEVYGVAHYPTAINAFESITQFVTCEFAVRPFLLQYPEQMMKQMRTWSKHPQAMVRRLATEGCRPRLPWAMGIPALKKDPKSILPILKNLKNDTSESVRRSVANNLNDISKDHPTLVMELATAWKGENPAIDALVKHACRTLLKQGNTPMMELFGFGSIDAIKIEDFKVLTPEIQIGDYVTFSFTLLNTSATPSKIRLEYGIYFQKANGSLSRKVFKISEKVYAANSATSIHRKQAFKVITTRKLHLGKHQVALIINGKELEVYDFELV